MKRRNGWIGRRRIAALLCVAVGSGLLGRTESVQAGERKFLVILATSPKELVNPSLPSPQVIRNRYFDKSDPNISSFAEYWEEISYGDVTIKGSVTDWILLPWPLSGTLTSPPIGYDGEEFEDPPLLRENAMVPVEIGGPVTDPDYLLGAEQTTPGGIAVWTPGERFFDANGNGVWDGVDEARNSMDWRKNGSCDPDSENCRPDGKPDLLGPWVDLNEDGVAFNTPGCQYLQDSDNDGNPNCCPYGSTGLGCKAYPNTGACIATTWNGRGNTVIFDCNGNLIPDACDISCTSAACQATGWVLAYDGAQYCGKSTDRLPYQSQGGQCNPGQGDGVPDECQYLSPDRPCIAAPITCEGENQDPCCNQTNGGTAICTAIQPPRTPVPRCEYDDSNDNGTLDVPEAFENFVNGVPFTDPDPRRENPLAVPGSDYDTYIKNNYPGKDPNVVIRRKKVRAIGGPHDPNNKVPLNCNCSDGDPCRNIPGPIGQPNQKACPAGVHAEYDPPDAWVERGTSKTLFGSLLITTTEPVWYKQAWRDRYNNLPPPTWEAGAVSTALVTAAAPFNPDRGGLNGRGDGVGPETVGVLPDTMGGVLTLYDGPVEFDDLPSSKYHLTGDNAIGEVTSPFSDDVWGEDRGDNNPNNVGEPDGEIPAGGPYATRVHGQNGRDAGNVLQMEWLTWRTQAPFNDGATWEAVHMQPHHYATQVGPLPVGAKLGFRDYNLDGRMDLGGTRRPGPGNYLSGVYPFDRTRLVEDCIAVLDETLDFDGLVDPVAMNAALCPYAPPFSQTLPPPFQAQPPIPIAGFLSGMVLLPVGSPAFPLTAPSFQPIHNEDGLNDPVYLSSNFPQAPNTPQLNWNIWFHNLVFALGGALGEPGSGATGDFGITFAAHEYGHSWQHFPDLYDYDAKDNSGVINCPVGAWDLMASGGLVHPIPALKEAQCTAWIKPVDLTTVLTPGVEKTVTFPSAEFIRDNSYYFLQNEDRPGEKYFFWSAGNGFDRFMPGEGLLIVHADPNESNPDAIALQQRSGLRPAFKVVQADGLAELEAGPGLDPACGDAGDAWPGNTNNTEFDCSTLPASQWYTDGACTGLEILDIVPDGSGSTRVTFNWTPTSIPSLRFIDPPGGTSVGNTFQIRAEANDVYGGTWIRYFYTQTDTQTPLQTDGTPIALLRKTTPATTELSVNWNISGLADGRYFIFADLIPEQGADGDEAALTFPRAGRNNQGKASLATCVGGARNGLACLTRDDCPDTAPPLAPSKGVCTPNVIVDVSTIAGNQVSHEGKSRLETWVAECVDATNGKWVVSSSLTQPLAAGGPSLATCTTTPALCATTGTQYTSTSSAVKFTIKPGEGSLGKGAVGDMFTFTTTGLTAPSAAVTVTAGRVTEDPIAVIDASPLSGLPPLTVKFDARRSRDPNGQPLAFRWDFGDSSAPQTGAQVQHTYNQAQKFTAVLRATNPANSRFGETAVDIEVINNSPKAVIKANPSSGPAPLTVSFSASDSSDMETPSTQLIYQWNFGDGSAANDQRTPGILRETEHLYTQQITGRVCEKDCTPANPCVCSKQCPCVFSATLTVTDAGGKDSTASIPISVGNTNPVANVTFSSAQGNSPLTVTFNAKNSTDADNDTLTVEWTWGDGSAVETLPAKTGKAPATDGSVPHTYTLTAGQTSGTFKPTAKIKDGRGGEAIWPGTTITVTATGPTDSVPRALFTISPAQPLLNQEFTVDASLSFDRPTGGQIKAYEWDWGDQTTRSTGVTAKHTYTKAGRYTIALTVSDAETPPNKATTSKLVVISSVAPPPTDANRPPAASLVVTPPEGFVDEVFTFDARGSTDPDGDALSYRFIFGDGQERAFAAGATTTHRYTQAGTYTTRLTVRDENNASTDLTRSVRVLLQGENRTPIALIATGLRTGVIPITMTFDGRISYDPDGDPIMYTWTFTLDGVVVDTLTGSVVTRAFDEAGTYTVLLAVTDRDGLVGVSEPETVVVTVPITVPEPPPPRPPPTPEDPPPSYEQRPTQVCGVGMLMSFFGTLLGLSTMRAARRRRSQP